MSSTGSLRDIPARYRNGMRGGITSICSAHPVVIEAALLEGVATNTDVLIEATCNQVNQDGGYTGMTPAGFRRFVEEIAARVGFDAKRLILGGDHLGPNPWKHLPAEEAMLKSEVMIDAFVRAGFTKIHLDTSMGCAGEPVALPDAVTAERAARLARVSEAAAREAGYDLPVYIIGTEVPIRRGDGRNRGTGTDQTGSGPRNGRRSPQGFRGAGTGRRIFARHRRGGAAGRGVRQ